MGRSDGPPRGGGEAKGASSLVILTSKIRFNDSERRRGAGGVARFLGEDRGWPMGPPPGPGASVFRQSGVRIRNTHARIAQ